MYDTLIFTNTRLENLQIKELFILKPVANVLPVNILFQKILLLILSNLVEC